jgi:hypothetical protein
MTLGASHKERATLSQTRPVRCIPRLAPPARSRLLALTSGSWPQASSAAAFDGCPSSSSRRDAKSRPGVLRFGCQ